MEVFIVNCNEKTKKVVLYFHIFWYCFNGGGVPSHSVLLFTLYIVCHKTLPICVMPTLASYNGLLWCSYKFEQKGEKDIEK